MLASVTFACVAGFSFLDGVLAVGDDLLTLPLDGFSRLSFSEDLTVLFKEVSLGLAETDAGVSAAFVEFDAVAVDALDLDVSGDAFAGVVFAAAEPVGLDDDWLAATGDADAFGGVVDVAADFGAVADAFNNDGDDTVVAAFVVAEATTGGCADSVVEASGTVAAFDEAGPVGVLDEGVGIFAGDFFDTAVDADALIAPAVGFSPDLAASGTCPAAFGFLTSGPAEGFSGDPFAGETSKEAVGVVLIGLLFFRGVCFVRGETAAFTFGDNFCGVVGTVALAGDTAEDETGSLGEIGSTLLAFNA